MPRVPTQELYQLARTLLRRLGGEAFDAKAPERLAPELRRIYPRTPVAPYAEVPPLLRPEVFDLPATPSFTQRVLPDVPSFSQPEKVINRAKAAPEVNEAALAMDRVINNVYKRFAPSYVSSQQGPKPQMGGRHWAVGKAGAAKPAERLLTRKDLINELSRRMLYEAQENPTRTVSQMAGQLEQGLGHWAAKRTATLSGEPRAAAEQRRLLARAAQLTGRTPDEARVGRAKAWLEKHNLIESPRVEGVTLWSKNKAGVLQEVDNPRVLDAMDPDRVLELKRAGPEGSVDINVPQVRTALTKLGQLINDPRFLSEKQRAVLNLRLGLEGGEGLTVTEIAKSLGISQPTVTNTVKASLGKLRKALEKAGVEFNPPEKANYPLVEAPTGRGARRIPESQGRVLRMAEEVRPGGPSASHPFFGAQGSVTPRVRSFTEEVPLVMQGSTPAGHLFAARQELPSRVDQWLRKDAESARLVNQLLSLVKNAKGKSIVPLRHLVKPKYRWLSEPLVTAETRQPGRQIKLPSTSPAPRRRTLSTKEQQALTRNVKPTKLIPDPNGNVLIGDRRYRRVNLVGRKIRNPRNPRELITVYVEEGQ